MYETDEQYLKRQQAIRANRMPPPTDTQRTSEIENQAPSAYIYSRIAKSIGGLFEHGLGPIFVFKRVTRPPQLAARFVRFATACPNGIPCGQD